LTDTEWLEEWPITGILSEFLDEPTMFNIINLNSNTSFQMSAYKKESFIMAAINNPISIDEYDHLFCLIKVEDERLFGRFVGPNYYGQILGKYVDEVTVKLQLTYYSNAHLTDKIEFWIIDDKNHYFKPTSKMLLLNTIYTTADANKWKD